MSWINIIIIVLVTFNLFQMFVFESKFKKLTDHSVKAFTIINIALKELEDNKKDKGE